MKAFLCTTFVVSLFSFIPNDGIIGKWETKPSPKGNITTVIFKDDNSFEGFINRKPFVSGHYSFSDGVLSFTDNGCKGQQGIYKIDFFSNSDSLRFEPSSDSCDERRNGMIRTVLGRVK